MNRRSSGHGARMDFRFARARFLARLPSVRTHTRWSWLPLAAALLAGCSAAPAPQSVTPPPSTADTPPGYVSGAPDTTGPVPGSASSPYVFRFKQIEPSSDRFTFRDRDVTFYFRPGPTALYFKVENLRRCRT